MQMIREVLALLVYLYILVLLARFVVEWIQALAPRWSPTGFLLVVLEFIYTLTDPPLRALRRVIPPVRLGSVSLDLSFMVLLLALYLVLRLLS